MMSSIARCRRSIRLPGYDYAGVGWYFVTICTNGRACLFGDIVGGTMVLNECGRIVSQELIRTPTIRREIRLDAWVIMPNHVHIIVVIDDVGSHDGTARPVGATGHDAVMKTNATGDNTIVGATGRSPPPAPRGPSPRSLGSFVAGFKSAVTLGINRYRDTPGQPVWQRNYYEHIIRDGRSYDMIKRYVLENPMRWEHDEQNPDRRA